MSEVLIPAHLPDWIRDHIHRYLESDGADGHMWDSSSVGGPGLVPTLLLTTTGRKSGKPQILPLIYGKAGKGYVIVASKGGAPSHPAWYINLTAHPEVAVQVGAKRFRASHGSGAIDALGPNGWNLSPLRGLPEENRARDSHSDPGTARGLNRPPARDQLTKNHMIKCKGKRNNLFFEDHLFRFIILIKI
jgi:hypothetical protein